MSAQSTGMFPRSGLYVDLETTFEAVTGHASNPDVSAKLTVPKLAHSTEVYFLAYFSPDATGYVVVIDDDDEELVRIKAPAGGGRVALLRSGQELGAVTSLRLASSDFASTPASTLKAGSVQVSVCSEAGHPS